MQWNETSLPFLYFLSQCRNKTYSYFFGGGDWRAPGVYVTSGNVFKTWITQLFDFSTIANAVDWSSYFKLWSAWEYVTVKQRALTSTPFFSILQQYFDCQQNSLTHDLAVQMGSSLKAICASLKLLPKLHLYCFYLMPSHYLMCSTLVNFVVSDCSL